MVMGKHSGRHAFRSRLQELGFDLDNEALERAFDRFKQLADLKKEILDDDLVALAEEALFIDQQATWKLLSMNVFSGTNCHPTATVRMSFEGREYIDSATGDGPVDAVFATIDRITSNPMKVLEYHLDAVTEGQDAQGRVTLTVTREERGSLKAKGRAVSTDIVEASAKAYVSALNALDRMEKLASRNSQETVDVKGP
jgi:2-isopropylmalate synthase